MGKKIALVILIAAIIILQLVWLGQKAGDLHRHETHSPPIRQIPSRIGDEKAYAKFGFKTPRQVLAAVYLIETQSQAVLRPAQKQRIRGDINSIIQDEAFIRQKTRLFSQCLTAGQINFIAGQYFKADQMPEYPLQTPADRREDSLLYTAEKLLEIRASIPGGPGLTPAAAPQPELLLHQWAWGILALESMKLLSLTPAQAGVGLKDFKAASEADFRCRIRILGWPDFFNQVQMAFLKGHWQEINEISAKINLENVKDLLQDS